jgi:hypothetical protein
VGHEQRQRYPQGRPRGDLLGAGRLAAGVRIEQAGAEMDAIAGGLARAYHRGMRTRDAGGVESPCAVRCRSDIVYYR